MSKLKPYEVIVKTTAEWSGTVHAQSLADAKRLGEEAFNDGNLEQFEEDIATVIAFKLHRRAGSWRTFERRFRPIDNPDETLWWRHEQLPVDVDQRLVWTIVDEDGRLYVRPGLRFVNRVEYVFCAEPWVDEDLHQPDYRYD
jgi:hypothetical protein